MQFSNSIALLSEYYPTAPTVLMLANFIIPFPSFFILYMKTAESRLGLFVSGGNLRERKFSSDNLIIPSYSRRAGGEEEPPACQGKRRPVVVLERTVWQCWLSSSSAL